MSRSCSRDFVSRVIAAMRLARRPLARRRAARRSAARASVIGTVWKDATGTSARSAPFALTQPSGSVSRNARACACARLSRTIGHPPSRHVRTRTAGAQFARGHTEFAQRQRAGLLQPDPDAASRHGGVAVPAMPQLAVHEQPPLAVVDLERNIRPFVRRNRARRARGMRPALLRVSLRNHGAASTIAPCSSKARKRLCAPNTRRSATSASWPRRDSRQRAFSKCRRDGRCIRLREWPRDARRHQDRRAGWLLRAGTRSVRATASCYQWQRSLHGRGPISRVGVSSRRTVSPSLLRSSGQVTTIRSDVLGRSSQNRYR
jgi:hypothetical protein